MNEKGNAGVVPALGPMPRPQHIPLAPAQERMWHAWRAGRSGDWNVARALRIRGAVDAAALCSAVRDVVARHAPLRTRFPDTADGPAQVVIEAADADVDVRALDSDESSLSRVLAEFASHAFDLEADLPIRARVYRLGDGGVVLALLIHHIAVDGRSLEPLTRDLMTAYLARAAGRAPDWAELPVDYVDYTLWKLAALGDREDEFSSANQQLWYWYNSLAGRPAPLEFPYDRGRPEVPDTTGDTIAVAIDAGTHRRLLDRAEQANASLFMVLQTAFALSVSRFAGCADVTVATAVSGRDHTLLDDLVGNFADDVLMRIRLDRAADLDDLLDQVRRVALGAFAHPDTPNQRLKRCLLQDQRDPLFQCTLILQRATVQRHSQVAEEESPVTEVPIGVVCAKHDLEFGLTECYDPQGTPMGAEGVFIYPTALFARDTAQRFVDDFLASAGLLADGYPGPITGLIGRRGRRKIRRSPTSATISH